MNENHQGDTKPTRGAVTAYIPLGDHLYTTEGIAARVAKHVGEVKPCGLP